MSITLHIHPDQFKVDLGLASSSHPAYATVQFDTTRDVILFLDSMGRCDALIAAATQAKYLLAEAEKNRLRQDGEALGRRIAADEGIEPESLYVVVEVDGGVVRATVTNPMPKAGAEQYARDYAHAHDGTLRVVPVADLDDEPEPKADPVPWPTGLCGHKVPPGAWADGFHYCRDCTASSIRHRFDEAAAPNLTVVDTPARPEDLDDADGES